MYRVENLELAAMNFHSDRGTFSRCVFQAQRGGCKKQPQAAKTDKLHERIAVQRDVAAARRNTDVAGGEHGAHSDRSWRMREGHSHVETKMAIGRCKFLIHCIF